MENDKKGQIDQLLCEKKEIESKISLLRTQLKNRIRRIKDLRGDAIKRK